MTSKRIVLHFPQRLVDKPIVYRLIKDYNLEFNILKAYVTPQEEGLMVLELRGADQEYEKGLEYLRQSGVKIQPLGEDVKRNSSKCTDCGVCVTVCPAGALFVDPKTRKVNFDEEKCIACELCIKICPSHAMEVHF
ncbi:MAG TPA: 4Fe-4S binding protein [Candidatus Omnitrophota bacterium]|nr:4Fe-4S binding protein [Candidatus Omnitrophota bacterium]HQJ15290.1 4Fe-4S binding protein [Candidatus Omnitrophota bacterium]